MDLGQAMALEKLRTPIFHKDAAEKVNKLSASDIAKKVISAIDKEKWLKKVASKEFILTRIPLSAAAVVDTTYKTKMEASASIREKPIVVDINKNKSNSGITSAYCPKVVVIDGAAHHTYARLNGKQTILAWVGAEAAKILNIYADHQFGSQELQSRLSELLREKLVPKKSSGESVGPWPYVQEVYPFEDYFIYQFEGKLWKQKYKVDLKKRNVSFDGDSEQVIQKYVDLDAQQTPMEKTLQLSKPIGNVAKKLAGGAIANATAPGTGVGPRINVAPPPKSELGKRNMSFGGPGSGRHANEGLHNVLTKAGYTHTNFDGQKSTYSHPSRGGISTYTSGKWKSPSKSGSGYSSLLTYLKGKDQ